MWFLLAGIALLVLYLAGIEPVSHWHWVFIALPFGLAAAWWVFIDASGITRKREERKIEARKVARRERDMEALGLKITRRDPRGKRSAGGASRSAETSSSEPPRRDPRP